MLDLILSAIPAVISAGVIALLGAAVRLLQSIKKQNKQGQDDIKNDLKELKSEIADIKETQYDLLRDRLSHLLSKSLEQESCSQRERENIERLFRDYKEKLHGNGIIEDMYHRVCKLPYQIKDEND